MEDLASVVMKGGGGGGKQESALRRRLKAGIGSAAEMAELVRQGIANSTERNDSLLNNNLIKHLCASYVAGAIRFR